MKRRGETQIGILIIFAITLVIAVSIVAIITFFYQKSLKNKTYISILGHSNSSIEDLQKIGLCKTSSYSKIKYNPIYDTYKLTCKNNLGSDLFSKISINILSGCSSSDNFCIYKIRK